MMKFKLALLLCSLTVFTGCATNVEWQDESVIGINKERPHATMTPFASEKQALKGQSQGSDH